MPRGTKGSVTPNPGEDLKPVKNGWLVVAVLCSLFIMLILGGGDIYLVRHPTVSTKLFGTSIIEDEPTKALPKKSPAKDVRKDSIPIAPEMTFYTRLSLPSESTPRAEKGEEPPAETAGHSVEVVDNGKAAAKSPVSGGLPDAKFSAAGADTRHTAFERSLPEPQKGSPIYTVQVGAFTQPGIAQEWAAKWKARGYEVALKPVARPKTGIIYRLYLGSFSSEKSAEELVKHLKVKEGISAFTLVLRN